MILLWVLLLISWRSVPPGLTMTSGTWMMEDLRGSLVLLTNVMIYWTSGCIISSMRFYKENFSKGLDQPHSKMPVHVPTGFACSPNELMYTPKLWVQQKYHKLKTFTPMARGGHFAGMEEPELMAQDI